MNLRGGEDSTTISELGKTVSERQPTLVCVLPASLGDLEGEADRVQHGVAQHRAWQSRIRRP